MARKHNDTETITDASLRKGIERHSRYWLGQDADDLSSREVFMTLAMTVRERIVDRMLETQKRYEKADAKRLYYMSMEFLMGRSLRNNLCNLGIYDQCRDALLQMGVDLGDLERMEGDAALGNGGLGRLAACFLDSLATLGMPGYGYGINYEFGLFKQEIRNGYQRELPDHWLAFPSPWQIERPDEACPVPLYGRVEDQVDALGNYRPRWVGWKLLKGIPHDMPIVGYGGQTVNFLRLYSARASSEFDMRIFNEGDFFKAVEQKMTTETISKVLYPTDVFEAGRELRLIQEFFLVACAVRDIMRRFRKTGHDFETFPEKVAIQLNDTHPALAVAELMRMLLDEHDLPWEKAWDITRKTLGYTNHTLMPEALEKWRVEVLGRVLPRHLQIIYEINRRFLDEVTVRWPDDDERRRRMSIIEEKPVKKVRMAHLSVVGSHAVNGVAALHSKLVETRLLPDFYEMWPERFTNKTNGVTPRRWILEANPLLAALITDTLGDDRWLTDLERVRALEPKADDAEFQERFLDIKRANKECLARTIRAATRVAVNPDSLFDVHIKRIHEYKRQLLNVMHIVHQYLRLIEAGEAPAVPRTYVFAGKAAPGYWVAKQIIKLISNVGQIVNNDRRVNDLIKVVFLPNYRVSLAERIIPAADLSEQISTAGTEASGTGNMKFAMNGALTIGTLDGANIEIREQVGPENFYNFGLTIEEIEEIQRDFAYNPELTCATHPPVQRVMQALGSDMFCADEPGLFGWVLDIIFKQGDRYFHLADLPSYIDAHDAAEHDFSDRRLWARKAILNVARMGRFSSDRTIREYAEDIWGIKPVL